MQTARHHPFRKFVVTMFSLIVLLVIVTHAPITRTHAIQSDPVRKLEAGWMADTSSHPIAYPGFMTADEQGNLYVTDRGADGSTYQIVHFDPDGKFVGAWGAAGSGPGRFNWRPANPDDGPDVGYVAADNAGHVYVSDGYNFRVQKFDSNGTFLLAWDMGGEAAREFRWPTAGPISLDAHGNVHVANFDRVQTFDSDGQLLASFGSAGREEGQFMGAGQIGWDSQGNRYVPDRLNGRVQKFDAEGNFLLQIGAPGDGDGEFSAPVQVVVDSQDHLFVMDHSNRIQGFDTDGNFLQKLVQADNGDGPYESIGSMAIDGQDDLNVQFYRPEDGVTIYKFGFGLSYRQEDGVPLPFYQFTRK